MRRLLWISFVLAATVAADAHAQRTDLGLTGFSPREQSQVQPSGEYLVITTTAVIQGGAQRCVDFNPPVGGFGGVLFVPRRLANGRTNLGSAVIAIEPYAGPGCTGLSLMTVTATPAIDNSSPRDVDIPISFLGGIPAAARSFRFAVYTAAAGEDPFMVCFRDPWLQNGFVGSPDLAVTGITVHVGDLGIAFPASSQPIYHLTPQLPLKHGEMVPRGRIAMVYVDVKNVGTAPANPPWSVTITPPPTRLGWSTVTFTNNCRDFANLTHNAATPMAPGEERTLCGAFVPALGAAAVRVSAKASVANDADPQNNEMSSGFFEVENTRGIQSIPALTPKPSNGRR